MTYTFKIGKRDYDFKDKLQEIDYEIFIAFNYYYSTYIWFAVLVIEEAHILLKCVRIQSMNICVFVTYYWWSILMKRGNMKTAWRSQRSLSEILSDKNIVKLRKIQTK